MRRLRSMWLALGVSVAFCACAETRDDDNLTHAVAEFISAVESENWDSAWALTSKDAQQELVKIHGLLHDALATVPLVYPEATQESAAAAVGRDVIGDIEADAPDLGPRFMSRLLDPSVLRFDQEARDGLLSATTTIEGDRASLVTAAGETFTFVRAPGTTVDAQIWRSRTVIDILDASEEMNQLKEQAQALLNVKDAHQQAWRNSLDPRTPQGAYNRLREACRAQPVDAVTIHALIGDDARATLEQTLKQARIVQRIVQRRTRLAERNESYRRRGITMFVKARTDLQLYTAWAKTDEWRQPVQVDAEPIRVEHASPDDSMAKVFTSNGATTMMRKTPSGLWELVGYEDDIREALLASIEGRLKALRPSR